MAVVGPGTEVRGSGELTGAGQLIGIENHHDVPVAVLGVTVGDHAAEFGWRELTGSHLQAGERVLHMGRGGQALLRWLDDSGRSRKERR